MWAGGPGVKRGYWQLAKALFTEYSIPAAAGRNLSAAKYAAILSVRFIYI